MDSLKHYATISLAAYSEATQVATGWAWLGFLDHGDYLNYIGMSLLCGITILCFATILPSFVRRRDWIYVGLVLVQILVFVAAMTGLVGGALH